MNLRPLRPERSALAKLSYTPWWLVFPRVCGLAGRRDHVCDAWY